MTEYERKLLLAKHWKQWEGKRILDGALAAEAAGLYKRNDGPAKQK